MLKARPADISSDESSENLIVKEGMAYPSFQEAVDVTEQLLKKISKRVPVPDAACDIFTLTQYSVQPRYSD